MAAAGRPVSELCPLGGAVSLESTLSGQLLFDKSKSATIPPSTDGGPGDTCKEEPKDAISEICRQTTAHPAGETRAGEPGQQKQSSSEQCAASRASSRPHSLTETFTPSYQHDVVINAIQEKPQAGRTAQIINPASLPVHRSHSGTLPLAPGRETCGLAYHGGDDISETESHSMLACKQPMQLQPCNIITTICRGAPCGEGGVQQPPSRCVCVSCPKAASKKEGVEKNMNHLPAQCDKALCCGSYIHHANFEDTFAAYCHPQPIPAPSQVLPRPVESSCEVQRAAAMNQLTLPRLISSVSETGLDAKHLLRCCNLSCSWISALPPGAGPQSQKNFGLEECCSIRPITRDTGTMTTHKELRDMGVQTGQSVTPHVFPQVSLAEESSQTPNSNADRGKKPGGAPKSPVKEVKWDAEGMTWEVYGASVDPEELGLAIQKHLELQIKETASHAAKLTRQNTNTSRQSGNAGRQRKRSRMMGSFRTPVCCAGSTTAVD